MSLEQCYLVINFSRSIIDSLKSLQVSDSLDLPQDFLNSFSITFSKSFSELITVFLQIEEYIFLEQDSLKVLSVIALDNIDENEEIPLFALISDKLTSDAFSQIELG